MLSKEMEPDTGKTLKRRALFEYQKNYYDIAVTDPGFDSFPTDIELQDSILCISLGERYVQTNAHHKIVAGILKAVCPDKKECA